MPSGCSVILPAGPLGVLVVDDEPAILRFLRMGLTGQGYSVSTVDTGRGALDAVHAGSVDLMVLDLGLPDIDGLDIIAQVRGEGCHIPIIVLSSRIEERSKVMALDIGADDYLAKPFGIDELLARVRVAQRHRLARDGDTPIFRVGDLTVDQVRRIVTVRGEDVKLSSREYDLLRLLVSHAGKVLTRDFILREVRGSGTNVQYLRIYIRALRQKIELIPERPDCILTETGVGYRLRALD
jgi:two-component system, OmpR family, KDP operon response regulator KdpE